MLSDSDEFRRCNQDARSETQAVHFGDLADDTQVLAAPGRVELLLANLPANRISAETAFPSLDSVKQSCPIPNSSVTRSKRNTRSAFCASHTLRVGHFSGQIGQERRRTRSFGSRSSNRPAASSEISDHLFFLLPRVFTASLQRRITTS